MKNDKTSNLKKWILEGVDCEYARFHWPAPPFKDKEPVSEFCLANKQAKYIVTSLVYTPNGLIWTANGEMDIMPLANVIYTRSIV